MADNKSSPSGKAISIVDAEWGALSGLPYLQVRLYLVLRWYMSMATGRVGEVRGISLQSLGEELYVEPAPGRSDSGSPTRKAVRSALQQLENHGLIRPCGNGEVLVFFLPKAGSVSARQKTKGHKRGTVSGHAMGHGETQDWQGVSAVIGHAMGQGVKAIKGHTSEVRVNHPSTQAAAAECAPVDNSAPVDNLLLPLLAEKVAEWLRRQESARGCRSRIVAQAAQIAAWIAMGMTGDELREAYALARSDRDGEQNRSPINLPFLDIFVRRVIDGRRVSRKVEAEPTVRLWRNSAEGIGAKAAEVGVMPEPGETIEGLRGRVEFALMLREHEAGQRRRSAGKSRGEPCRI